MCAIDLARALILRFARNGQVADVFCEYWKKTMLVDVLRFRGPAW